MKKLAWIFVGLALLGLAAPASMAKTAKKVPAKGVAATEVIRSFHSEITVNKDTTLTVKETIDVTSTGDRIKHGIYRDFPTRYKDGSGNDYVVEFAVQSTTSDGSPASYHTTAMENGRRVYIGDANKLLAAGPHTYTITYTTTGQLGLFGDHDELYWNVTGNGWAFAINSASAVVTLPKGIPASKIKTEGYTGPQGSKARNCTSRIDSSGRAIFASTVKLPPYNGLTIVVTWPKGFTKPAASSSAHTLPARPEPESGIIAHTPPP